MCDSCSCKEYVPNVWKAGKCRECQHSITMHTSVSITTENLITINEPTSQTNEEKEKIIKKVGRLSTDQLKPFSTPLSSPLLESKRDSRRLSKNLRFTPTPSPSLQSPSRLSVNLNINLPKLSELPTDVIFPPPPSPIQTSAVEMPPIESLPIPPPLLLGLSPDIKRNSPNMMESLLAPIFSNDINIKSDQNSTEKFFRERVLDEILRTEQDYCKDLDFVVTEVMAPLSKILSKSELTAIFSNIQVIKNVNDSLLKGLTLDPNSPGRTFLQLYEFFKCYAQYCTHHNTALSSLQQAKLNSDVSSLLKKAKENPRSGNLSLEDYLIKPVQRICKYPLLLKELLKYTRKNDPDYPPLNKAYNHMQEVAMHVNEFSREAEAMNQVVSIQSQLDLPFPLVTSSRRLLHHDQVLIKSPQSESTHWSNRYLWVFNDLLLWAKIPKVQFSKSRYHYVGHMSIKTTGIKENGCGNSEENTFTLLEIVGEKEVEVVVVLCGNKTDRDNWVKIISTQISVQSEINNRISGVFKPVNPSTTAKRMTVRFSNAAQDSIVKSLNEVISKRNSAEENSSNDEGNNIKAYQKVLLKSASEIPQTNTKLENPRASVIQKSISTILPQNASEVNDIFSPPVITTPSSNQVTPQNYQANTLLSNGMMANGMKKSSGLPNKDNTTEQKKSPMSLLKSRFKH